MKEKKDMKNFEENESGELNIEEITMIQGGIESDGKKDPGGTCGLGCFQGSGSVESISSND